MVSITYCSAHSLHNVESDLKSWRSIPFYNAWMESKK